MVRTLARLAVAAAVIGGCGSGGPSASTPPQTGVVALPSATLAPAATTMAVATPKPTADVAHPVGVIAIGHSALTGEGTAGPQQPNLDASWATGTLAEVNSLSMRLIAIWPQTEGKVVNKATGGAPASALLAQAQKALAEVPAPALAIVDTIDNDLRCDAATVQQVGEQISKALTYIHERSPNTIILVVDQPGRPSKTFVEGLVKLDPSQKASLTWDDPCTFYTADGKLNETGFTKLTAAIDAYEAEQFRVCALVPNCHDDGGVRRAYVDVFENFSPDCAHFNVKGQAAQAELLWPVVEQILGLRPAN